jgi:hypothetical protein
MIAAAALTMIAEPALAEKALLHRQPAIGWYRLSGDVEVRCVEQSFSVSVGNPAFHRLAIWPAPCRPWRLTAALFLSPAFAKHAIEDRVHVLRVIAEVELGAERLLRQYARHFPVAEQ